MGVLMGVSTIVTLVYGPHTVRIDPMPLVPPSPPRSISSKLLIDLREITD